MTPRAVLTADPELPNPAATEVDRQVAARIAAEIEDGACLQIGIGGVPNAVRAVLKDAGIRDLGIHTEMFVDSMVDLVEAGIVTGARKQIDRFESVYTFAGGSRRTYDFRPPPAGAEPRGGLHQPAPHAPPTRRVVSAGRLW